MHPPDRRLDALDDALLRTRRLAQRDGYRRRILEGLDVPGGLTAVRALRAVERVGSRAPSIGDVAAMLGLDPSTTSRIVDRCVNAGLLARERHPTDRRRTQVALTHSGHALLDSATRNRRALLDEVTSGWAGEDLERLVTLLEELADGFDRLEAP